MSGTGRLIPAATSAGSSFASQARACSSDSQTSNHAPAAVGRLAREVENDPVGKVLVADAHLHDHCVVLLFLEVRVVVHPCEGHQGSFVGKLKQRHVGRAAEA